jgi:hypothetical protein
MTVLVQRLGSKWVPYLPFFAYLGWCIRMLVPLSRAMGSCTVLYPVSDSVNWRIPFQNIPLLFILG